MKLCDAMAWLNAANNTVREAEAAHEAALSQYSHMRREDAGLMPDVMLAEAAKKAAIINKIATRDHIAKLIPNALRGNMGRLQ